MTAPLPVSSWGNAQSDAAEAHDANEAAVEKLARAICRSNGYGRMDPDRMVCRAVPEAVNTPRGVAYLMPLEHHLYPLWTEFADLARLAIREFAAASSKPKP